MNVEVAFGTAILVFHDRGRYLSPNRGSRQIYFSGWGSPHELSQKLFSAIRIEWPHRGLGAESLIYNAAWNALD